MGPEKAVREGEGRRVVARRVVLGRATGWTCHVSGVFSVARARARFLGDGGGGAWTGGILF